LKLPVSRTEKHVLSGMARRWNIPEKRPVIEGKS
jgi:hypothetical protein